ncbi:MAG: hypothetical protein J1E39_06955 [Eubacterium sp.]|nr:hypothetical protein [Eubacterium sp.]
MELSKKKIVLCCICAAVIGIFCALFVLCYPGVFVSSRRYPYGHTFWVLGTIISLVMIVAALLVNLYAVDPNKRARKFLAIALMICFGIFIALSVIFLFSFFSMIIAFPLSFAITLIALYGVMLTCAEREYKNLLLVELAITIVSFCAFLFIWSFAGETLRQYIHTIDPPIY